MFVIYLTLIIINSLSADSAKTGKTAVQAVSGTASVAGTITTTVAGIKKQKIASFAQKGEEYSKCQKCGSSSNTQCMILVELGDISCCADAYEVKDEIDGCDSGAVSSCASLCAGRGSSNAATVAGTVLTSAGMLGGISSSLIGGPTSSGGSGSYNNGANSSLDKNIGKKRQDISNSIMATCESKGSSEEKKRCYCESNGWKYDPKTGCSDTNTDIIASVEDTSDGQPDNAAFSDQEEKNAEAIAAGETKSGSSVSSSSTLIPSGAEKTVASPEYGEVKAGDFSPKKSLSLIALSARSKISGSNNINFKTRALKGKVSLKDLKPNEEIYPEKFDLFEILTARIYEKYYIGDIISLNKAPRQLINNTHKYKRFPASKGSGTRNRKRRKYR